MLLSKGAGNKDKSEIKTCWLKPFTSSSPLSYDLTQDRYFGPHSHLKWPMHMTQEPQYSKPTLWDCKMAVKYMPFFYQFNRANVASSINLSSLLSCSSLCLLNTVASEGLWDPELMTLLLLLPSATDKSYRMMKCTIVVCTPDAALLTTT